MPLFLGKRSDNYGTVHFGGSIDEVKVFNRALTAAEIMTEYAAGLRISELLHLRVEDIDSARMMIHIGLIGIVRK